MNRPFTIVARPLRDKNGPTQTFTVHARPAPPACPYHRVRCLPAQSRCSGGFAFYNVTCVWSWGRDACAPAPLDRCTTQPWVWL